MKKANELLFPILSSLTYLYLFLESYFYIGILRKYILLDSRFFIVLSIVSGIILLGTKLNKLNILFLKINSLIFPIAFGMYLVMQFMEASNFRNFVFSAYHLQPSNFFNLVFFSFLIILVNKISKSKYSFRELVIVTILGSLIVFGGLKIIDDATYSNLYIITHLNSTYDEKMNERWGIYYDYIKFVEENSPKNSSILVPPQETPWYSTGNVGLDRYFLYPRNMGNGNYDGKIDVLGYDYVMLVWGEWNNAPSYRYGWPKINLKAEKVIYFNPETKKVTEFAGGYIPSESVRRGVWGLIKLKK